MAKQSSKTVKHDITQLVLDLLPANTGITLDQALRTWYYNLRSSGGLRLTTLGLQAMRSASLNSWSIDINPRDLTKSNLLILDRKVQWPYFIDTRAKQLVMFSSRDAMMATLYGDIKSWLASLGSQQPAVKNP